MRRCGATGVSCHDPRKQKQNAKNGGTRNGAEKSRGEIIGSQLGQKPGYILYSTSLRVLDYTRQAIKGAEEDRNTERKKETMHSSLCEPACRPLLALSSRRGQVEVGLSGIKKSKGFLPLSEATFDKRVSNFPSGLRKTRTSASPFPQFELSPSPSCLSRSLLSLNLQGSLHASPLTMKFYSNHSLLVQIYHTRYEFCGSCPEQKAPKS